ncbi:Arc family DNA-binding protein [Rhizobium sp. PP-CC-3G-465]|uniref:Arc family DNA-binding protein n=1 Tax=Rhizobium sp. PP-CC-3G-465 TaxID=2135648 RepID=UPI001053C771|nr:Arc-like DNA binding dprotein [Rhizobium sp. PP-CC-3G-465]
MAREDLHFRLRIPGDLKAKVESAADSHDVSMTAEIIDRLEKSFDVAVPLPPGLAERIEVYAGRQGRTLVEEVVRLLEREYPAQWEVIDRMEHMANLLAALAAGTGDAAIDAFVTEMQETLEGIVSGRVKGVNEDVRDEVGALWSSYKARLNELQYDSDQQQFELDEEEEKMRRLIDRTEKLAEPRPSEPNPMSDSIFLSHVLSPRDLSALAESIRSGDVEAGAEIVRNLPMDAIAKRVRFEALPEESKYRLRREVGPSNGDDPFGFTE